ncbi:hypothetical protein ACSBR1_018304 [Camellia fascicularis]
MAKTESAICQNRFSVTSSPNAPPNSPPAQPSYPPNGTTSLLQSPIPPSTSTILCS